jgi:predicted Fe-Mo cluster-binding NifX family protein
MGTRCVANEPIVYCFDDYPMGEIGRGVGRQGDGRQNHPDPFGGGKLTRHAVDGGFADVQRELMERIEASYQFRRELEGGRIDRNRIDQSGAPGHTAIRPGKIRDKAAAVVHPAVFGNIADRFDPVYDIVPETMNVGGAGKHPGHADDGDGARPIHEKNYTISPNAIFSMISKTTQFTCLNANFYFINLDSSSAFQYSDKDHAHGHCQPVSAFCGHTVDAVVVGGIGRGALGKLHAAGIRTFRAVEGSVRDNLSIFTAGKLPQFTSAMTCAGHAEEGACSH